MDIGDENIRTNEIEDKKEFIQFLKWSSTDKCLFVSSLAFVSAILYIFAIEFLIRTPDFIPQFDRDTMAWGRKILPPLIVIYALIAFSAFKLREPSPEAKTLIYFTLFFFSIPNVFLVYLVGPVTSPIVGVALVGTGVVSMVLFDLKPALVIFATFTLCLLALTVLERIGVAPYAPLMTVEPTINGSPSDWWVITWGGISLLITIGLVAAFAWIVSEWRARDAMLEELSNTDGLTKLTNRRRYMEILEAECERAKRSGRPLSMLMCDADLFKNVNDTYGHHVGDQVLRVIASVLNDSVRVSTDTSARIGGEEFALLLAETDLESAKLVADRILKGMRKQSFTAAGKTFGVTLSIGLSTITGDHVAADMLMEASDALLYEAKDNGRDRLEAKAS